MSERKIEVQVCYALPHRQELVKLHLDEPASVEAAVQASGLLEKYPELSLGESKFGVYGKLVRLDSSLREGDRVEIYRPLIADPKEVRRKRAEEGKVTRKGGGEAETA
ncbi:MAG: RnfH family protein [Candidatus Dactylopiibacterium carminicum]|uniref:UPF0125 protein BGI27_13730 n=1 Tax=Candidatus Dactylopiibacterium carminicum TaxID=857335 RepID=A0A272EPC0_9RHOO|nr:RnfH family protein [Candidatus Dactylopiibacterium carminicum]KAF7598352.1 RnfH family protein [Candidatus Dactylopiibacterium carminicum]PAS91964.1 MAG: RnfH family protein [Candidatus Dactylopiibacterium carminicum]PAS95225.1 MAG: RnfH family protein [Candidatus Dactylopiibacterium carminicum]PAS97407.1 MAG: RnfH family protein [Candidatus Dactylopiibacterium carminicum]